ncbi:hypothetical protein [Ramlibacter sp.]|uniref:hypothetical protein n=1 Tax=Ramlibacter sp. TaxID=1917967 RepID=UPI003D105A81
MSLLDWLTPSKKKSAARANMNASDHPPSSGLSRIDSTRPFEAKRGMSAKNAQGARSMRSAGQVPGQPASRKQERLARRELLYAVVRECMGNAGVLSASYKFKVLSLDAHGLQFLVMVDLASEFAGDAARLSEIEVTIAQAAKARYDVRVTAVYWRSNEHVALGHSVEAKPPQARVAAAPRRYEPLLDEEVAAFKKALAHGATPTEALGANRPVARDLEGAMKQGPRSYTLLTGFEDTELPESEARMPVLSTSQYGELR